MVAALIGRGARVAAVDIFEEPLEELAKKLRSENGTLETYVADITDIATVGQLPERVRLKQGEVDGLINCVGIIQPFIRIRNIDYATVEKVMRVNFYGTLYMTKAFLPLLLERPEAHIVNVSSMGGFLPFPGQAIYGASKAAVKLMTEALYAELKSTNVGVTVVFPGATETQIAQHSGIEVPEQPSNRKIPMLKPEEVARLIVDGVEKNRLQVFTGKDSKTMNFLYRISPKRAIDAVTKSMGSFLRD